MWLNVVRSVMLLLAVTLGGCASLDGLLPKIAMTVGQIENAIPEAGDVVTRVIGTTKRLCGFEPIVATVAGVLTGGSVASVFDVAKMLCDALSSQPLAATKRRQLVTVHVRGVAVRGYYTPRR